MKTWLKVLLILGACLMLLGATFGTAAWALHGFSLNFEDPAATTWTEQIYMYPLAETPDISVSDQSASIVLTVDPQATAMTVKCTENEYYSYEILQDKEGGLHITYQDKRPWYAWISFGIDTSFWNRKVELTVPAELGIVRCTTLSGSVFLENSVTHAEELSLQSTSGNVCCSNITVSGDVFLTSTSGDVSGSNIEGLNLTAKSTSGNVLLTDCNLQGSLTATSLSSNCALLQVTAEGDLDCSTASGNIDLRKVSAKMSGIQSTSGEVEAHTVSASVLSVQTTSGDVELAGITAESLNLKSTSGDISGTVFGDPTTHLFEANTVSGTVKLPSNRDICTAEAVIYAETTSGDIELDFVK